MAKDKNITITSVIENNMSPKTVSKSVEQVVVGGQLVPDPAVVNPAVVNPGVITRNN